MPKTKFTPDPPKPVKPPPPRVCMACQKPLLPSERYFHAKCKPSPSKSFGRLELAQQDTSSGWKRASKSD